jgi:hypothetical protein
MFEQEEAIEKHYVLRMLNPDGTVSEATTRNYEDIYSYLDTQGQMYKMIGVYERQIRVTRETLGEKDLSETWASHLGQWDRFFYQLVVDDTVAVSPQPIFIRSRVCAMRKYAQLAELYGREHVQMVVPVEEHTPMECSLLCQ